MMESYDKIEQIFLGLDLGQKNDYSAICAVEVRQKYSPVKHPPMQIIECYGKYERDGETFMLIKHLHRWKLGTPYPDIVSDTGELLVKVEQNEEIWPFLVIDSTGVGTPVFDMFREARIKATGITIHGGSTVTREGGIYHVPKRDLVAVLQKLYQTERIKISGGLKEKDILNRELLNFKVKITESGNDTYSAWREKDHDDLVLAVACACWMAEKHKRKPRITKKDLGIRG